MDGLVVFQTHPIQYHSPLYQAVQRNFGIPVTAIYGSDSSVTGYFDKEFGTYFAWDTDLLSGYRSVFLSRVSPRGGNLIEKISARGMRGVLGQLRPQAILITGYATFFHQLAFYHAWRTGCSILFRADTADHARKRSAVRGWLRDRLLRRLYQRCERLLYIGQRSYEHFRRLACPDEKLVFSPYCVDTTPFRLSEDDHTRSRAAVRGSFGIKEEERVLLFSGKLSPRKGPDLLLEAIKKLPPEACTEIIVLFVGDGELKRRLEEMVKSCPSVRAYFVGFQNQTALSPYYHAADLAVVPSRHSEVWGLVVNEALHHGLPCVVSEGVGSAPDLIEPGKTGEIFQTGSVSSLADALLRAFSLIGRSEIRAKCREKVSSYTVERAAEGIARAYSTAVKGEGLAAQ